MGSCAQTSAKTLGSRAKTELEINAVSANTYLNVRKKKVDNQPREDALEEAFSGTYI